MPKVKQSLSALKETRRMLKSIKVRITDSSTESEASSEESAEFSHIPVNTVPNIEKFSLDDTDTDMEQLSAQVNNIAQLLELMRNTQQQQQQQIEALSHGQAQASATQNHIQQQSANSAVSVESLYKIPDPIKSLPKFDGNRKQLSAWLTTAENTLNRFKNLVNPDQFDIFVTAVANKIEGKAKDIICLAGNPQTFEEIRDILTSALGDRQELTYYKSQLWQTKMTDNMSVHKYYNRCKEIVQNIKSLAKQKRKYQDNWDAINSFIEEDALAAFLAGLKEPYFGYAQAAGPEDMEAAYAFVCKFRSKIETASNRDNFKKPSSFDPKEDKFRNNKYPNTTKQQFSKDDRIRTHPEQISSDPQPMETGSIKSRLTLNKRQINNNEVSEDEKSSDSEREDEDIDLNFCLATKANTQT